MPTNGQQQAAYTYVAPRLEWRMQKADEAWAIAYAEAAAMAKTQAEQQEFLLQQVKAKQDYITDLERSLNDAMKERRLLEGEPTSLGRTAENDSLLEWTRAATSIEGQRADVASANASRRLDAKRVVQGQYSLTPSQEVGATRSIQDLQASLTRGGDMTHYTAQIDRITPDVRAQLSGMTDRQARGYASQLYSNLTGTTGLSASDASALVTRMTGMPPVAFDPIRLVADQEAETEQAVEESQSGAAGLPYLADVAQAEVRKRVEGGLPGEAASAETSKALRDIRALTSTPEFLAAAAKLADTGDVAKLDAWERAAYEAVAAEIPTLSAAERKAAGSDVTRWFDPNYLQGIKREATLRGDISTARTSLAILEKQLAEPAPAPPTHEEIRQRAAEIYAPYHRESAPGSTKMREAARTDATKMREAAKGLPGIIEARDPKKQILQAAYTAANSRLSEGRPSRESLTEASRTLYDQVMAGEKTRKDVITAADSYAATTVPDESDVAGRQTARDTFVTDFMLLDLLDRRAKAPTPPTEKPATPPQPKSQYPFE